MTRGAFYDAVVKAVESFGKDAEIAPKKAYVSFRRKKQFAIVQPSTATRVDIGINLPGAPPTDRLEASGSFNSMVSHRVRLTDAKQVNAELKKWLKAAYEGAGRWALVGTGFQPLRRPWMAARHVPPPNRHNAPFKCLLRD